MSKKQIFENIGHTHRYLTFMLFESINNIRRTSNIRECIKKPMFMWIDGLKSTCDY